MTTQRWMIALLAFGVLLCGLVILVDDRGELSRAQPAGPGAANPGVTAQSEVDALPAAATATPQREGESVQLDTKALLEIEAAQREALTFGSLFITVRSFEDDEPLPGIRLTVEASKGRRLSRIRMLKPGPGASLGTPDDALLSDLHGLATFTVPARQSLTVRAWSEDGRTQPLEEEVDSLGNLEDRQLTLRLRTRLDLGLRGRVVTADGNSPIEGARVAVQSNASSLRTSKTDGEGRYWSWALSGTGDYLRIDHEGFTPAMIPVRPAPARGEATEMIALRRSGGIEFNLIDAASLALAQVHCIVTAAPLDLSRGLTEPQVRLEKFHFEGWTENDGKLQLPGLPSGVPLRIEFRPIKGGTHPLAEPIVLEPGRTTRCDFKLPGRLELRGTLSNQDGEPIEGQPMWAVQSHDTQRRVLDCSEDDPGKRGRDWAKGKKLLADTMFRAETLEQANAMLRASAVYQAKTVIRAVTLANGQFVFKDMLEGTYLVGPIPTCTRASHLCREPNHPTQTDVAPVGTPIRLVSANPNHLDLVLGQGLYLTGRVVNEGGRGIGSSTVEVRRPGLVGSAGFHAADLGGHFSVGPLDAGVWRISAEGQSMRSSIASVEPRLKSDTESSDEELRIVLRHAREGSSKGEAMGSIAGRLVTDSTRTLPNISGLFLQPRGASGASADVREVSFARDSGKFQIQGLTPGTYVLSARNFKQTPGPRRRHTRGQYGTEFATTTVTLPPGGVDLEGVQFNVGPVAQLNLRVSNETAESESDLKSGARSRWSYTVRSGAELVLRGVFWGLDSGPIAVPPGFLEAVVTEMDNGHAIFGSGEVILGEPLELVF